MSLKMKTVFAVLVVFFLMACSRSPESPVGFSLPEGDAARGEAVFNKYQCLSCHALKGYEDATIEQHLSPPVMLGGTSSMVKTYAQLVTSIINPSHKLAPRAFALESVVDSEGKSKMRNFNDTMTVSELIDIVAFLQPKYEVRPLQYTHYQSYHIP